MIAGKKIFIIYMTFLESSLVENQTRTETVPTTINAAPAPPPPPPPMSNGAPPPPPPPPPPFFNTN